MKSNLSKKLKKWCFFFIIAAIALFPIIIMAQGRTLTRDNRFEHGGLQGGDYLKIEELIIFEGIWQWVSAAGDSVFTLQLWREKFIFPVDLQTHLFSYDGIAGHYSLSVHGRIVSTNLNIRTERNLPTFGGSDFDNDGVDVLNIGFQDFVKNKWAIGRFELVWNNPNMARWSMRNRDMIVTAPGMVFHRGFSLPNNVVLHRVQATPPEPVLPPGWEVQ